MDVKTGVIITNHSLEHSLSFSRKFSNLEAFECVTVWEITHDIL